MDRPHRPPPRLPLLFATVAAPLAFGAGIYVAWRSPELRLFSWLDGAGLGDVVSRVRAGAAALRPAIPGWVLFSLPDGLWAFAAASATAAARRDPPTRGRSCWIVAAPALGTAWELGQAVGWLPGTFDAGDLLAYALAAAAALAVDHASTDPGARSAARDAAASAASLRRAVALRSFAVLVAFTLLLTGTSKAPPPSPSPAPLGGGGGPVVPPAPTSMSPLDLPAPWDTLGLPASALAVDAMRFVHENSSRRAVEAEYVASLSAMGWRVVRQAPPTAAEGAVVFERSGRRLALRLRTEGTTVRVSVNLLDPSTPDEAPEEDAGAPAGPIADAGSDAKAPARPKR